MGLDSYLLFLATAAVLVISPGPDTVLILSRTIASGGKAGFSTLIGTQAGNVVHAVLAGIGVSTIILLFPVAFNALKFAGVAYLLYLAFQSWRAAATLELAPGGLHDQASTWRYFFQGFTNNLANPKMIVFFLALFPQFIHPEAGSLAGQSLLLGGTLAAMAVAWIGLLIVAVSKFRASVVRNPVFLTVANRLAAVTFVGLAGRLAFDD